MNVSAAYASMSPAATTEKTVQAPQANAQDQELRQTFDQMVGETLFGQMLKSARKTVHKSAYFHGGRGEEVFQQQLDQMLTQKITAASADKLSGPMYELFTLNRK